LKKLVPLLLLVIFGVSNLTGQTWKQYNILTNTTTLLNYTVTSTTSSNNTTGNTGILSLNLSSDTIRNFSGIDLVNDPNAYPWRMTVKFGNVTGVLIDPYHVLTAGHTVTLDPGFGATKFYPGYGQGDSPYGFAYPVCIYLQTNYSISSASDYAVIKLDRPIGSLTGWVGYGYNNDNAFYTNNNIFFNPSYPSANLFNGELLYNWKGKPDYITGEYVYSFRTGFVGMSGSPLFTPVNNNLVTYGVLTSTGIKFNKININKFDAVKFALNTDIPSSVDIIPVTVSAYPKTLKTGYNLDSVSFYLTNYSTENYSNQQVSAGLYLSQDSIITDTDQLLQTYNVTGTISSLNTIKILINNVSVPGVSSGDYWIGLKLTGDNNTSNNTTGYRDACKIKVVNTDYVKISGRINSTQSGSGISGVILQGLTDTYTDFNGNYTTYVPAGFSGNIIPVKDGYSFSPASFTVNNLTGSFQQNLTTGKITHTLSISVKSPVQHMGVQGVQATELKNAPYSNANGMINVTVYHGWSGVANLIKSGWNIVPASISYNNITANTNSDVTAGFRVSGYIYNENGSAIPNVTMQGFPVSVTGNSSGYYQASLDSGWTGTVMPVKENTVFNPNNRVYAGLNLSMDYQDFQQSALVYANIKIFLSGAYSTGTDSMKCVLKQRNYFPVTPPETLSNNVNPFIFNGHNNHTYTGTEQRIVDWVVIEVLNPGDYTPVDTIPAVVRYDGQLLSITGSTMIPLKPGISAGYYYYVIRHRNHIAVMSGTQVYISKTSVLYDFTTGTDKYWGNEAKLLKSGLYGLFTGDANYDGKIDFDDYKLYNTSTISADHGDRICDFNLDGYVTSLDFTLFAPNNRLNISSKIPFNNKNLIIK
jgi:hypothetical protein